MRQLAPELVQPCDLCWPLWSSLVLMKHKAGGEGKLACRPTNIPRTSHVSCPAWGRIKFHSWRWGGCWNCLWFLDANGEGKRNEWGMGGLGAAPKCCFLIGSQPWWRQGYQVSTFFKKHKTTLYWHCWAKSDSLMSLGLADLFRNQTEPFISCCYCPQQLVYTLCMCICVCKMRPDGLQTMPRKEDVLWGSVPRAKLHTNTYRVMQHRHSPLHILQNLPS